MWKIHILSISPNSEIITLTLGNPGLYISYLYILYFRAWSVPWIIWRLWWTRGVSVRWFLHVNIIYHCFELLGWAWLTFFYGLIPHHIYILKRQYWWHQSWHIVIATRKKVNKAHCFRSSCATSTWQHSSGCSSKVLSHAIIHIEKYKKILQVSTYFSKSNFHYLWLLWGTCTSLSLDGVGHFYYLVTRRLFYKAFWNVLLANWAYDCLVVLYNLRNWNMRLMRKQLILAARQAIDQTPGQKNNPDTKRTQN